MVDPHFPQLINIHNLKIFFTTSNTYLGFPGGSVVKNLPASAGDIRDTGSIPRLGRSPGGGHGNPLQYSCLENPMDRGAWWAMVHGVTNSWTRLSNWTEVQICPFGPHWHQCLLSFAEPSSSIPCIFLCERLSIHIRI